MAKGLREALATMELAEIAAAEGDWKTAMDFAFEASLDAVGWEESETFWAKHQEFRRKADKKAENDRVAKDDNLFWSAVKTEE